MIDNEFFVGAPCQVVVLNVKRATGKPAFEPPQVVLDITAVEPEELLITAEGHSRAGRHQTGGDTLHMGVGAVHNTGVNRFQQSTTRVHIPQGLLEAQPEEVQVWDGSRHGRHPGAEDTKGGESRQACIGGGDRTGALLTQSRIPGRAWGWGR